MIPGFKDLSYNERLLLLKLPSLKYRRLRGDLIEVYNILNRKESDNVKTICRLSEVKHTRGHNKKLALSHSNTNRKKYSFSNRIVTHWNNLPANVVNATNTNCFKNLLDKSLSHLMYDFD